MSLDLVRAMKQQLDASQQKRQKLGSYYCGDQPLNFIHPDVRDRLSGRMSSLVINWPRLIVSSIEERLDVEGFRSGGDADQRLWSWWQSNDMDEWSQLAHTEAMVQSRAFCSVWADAERPGFPRIAVESASQMTVSFHPGTRVIDAALKVWKDPDVTPGVPDVVFAVLYLPDRVEKWVGESHTPLDWRLAEVLDNPLGRVPVEPIVNRPQLTRPLGESELADVLPVADAVNKLATDMMVSSEFHAMQRRWVTGMDSPRDGTAQAKLADDVRRKWVEAFPGKPWIGGGGVEFGQFAEASLDNFINAIKLLTSQIAAIAGLPPHYLGINADNPASAEAIRSAESSLVQRAKRKQRAFGGSWERVMRLAVDVVDGVGASEKLADLETDWRDPATPTPAESADAAVKLTQGERPIITIQQAQKDIGYTQQEIEQMRQDWVDDNALAATATVRAQIDLARELQAGGMSQQAAFAAVGLIVASQQMGTSSVA